MAEYRRAQWDALTGAVQLELPELAGDWSIRSGQAVRVDRGAVVEGPIMLGSGCHIGHDALVLPGSILGEGTVIHPGACVWNSVLGAGCCVEANAIIRDCVLDDAVRVGPAATVTGNTVVGRGALIGAGARLHGPERVAPVELAPGLDAAPVCRPRRSVHAVPNVRRDGARLLPSFEDDGALAEEELAVPA